MRASRRFSPSAGNNRTRPSLGMPEIGAVDGARPGVTRASYAHRDQYGARFQKSGHSARRPVFRTEAHQRCLIARAPISGRASEFKAWRSIKTQRIRNKAQ